MLKLFWRRSEWGQTLCAWFTLLSLFALAMRGVGEHFIFPTEGFRWLVDGRVPYGIILPRCTGPFLYSPTSAFLFFSWFSFLPEWLGQNIYMWFSVAFFFWGLSRFLRVLETQLHFSLGTHPLRSLFWLMLTSELVGAILGVKFEIFLVGGCLLAFSYWLTGRWWLAGFWFALIANFKLQALPVVLLGFAVSVGHRRGWRVIAAFAIGSAVLWLLPWPIFGTWSHFMSVNRAWMAGIDLQVSGEWTKAIYQHIFGFSDAAFGLPVPLETAKRATMVVAALLGLVAFGFSVRNKGENAYGQGLLFALGLGCLFVVTFSPLSQSNAYVWYVPAIFALLYFWRNIGVPIRSQGVVLVLAYLAISIFYSDLVPRSWYRTIYALRLKAAATLILLVVLSALPFLQPRRKTG